jgi:hypothetical protein
LMRGPVHEALAVQFAHRVTPGLLIAKEPPGRLRELPPEHRPEWKGIARIPGYWAWDDETGDFLWVSATPPNHRWVPGAWGRDENGYRWVSGLWSPLERDRLSYLPVPAGDQLPPWSTELIVALSTALARPDHAGRIVAGYPRTRVDLFQEQDGSAQEHEH